MSSVLAWVGIGRVQLGGVALIEGVRVEKGRLVAPSLKSDEWVGALFQGAASDGQPVEVALCSAEPWAEDPEVVWYRIEVWNEKSAMWENPCVATQDGPTPRALAMRGLWDKSGAHHDQPGRFTFACENGVIAKCVTWGYKPWATNGKRLLQGAHQACTRMARADYCGNGRSFTQNDTLVDVYDALGILTQTEATAESVDSRPLLFEAAWDSEGAVCMARTRDDRKIETILAECPDRFQVLLKDIGDGARCKVVRREGVTDSELLRNRSYGRGQ